MGSTSPCVAREGELDMHCSWPEGSHSEDGVFPLPFAKSSNGG